MLSSFAWIVNIRDNLGVPLVIVQLQSIVYLQCAIVQCIICQCTYNGCASCQCIEDRWHRPQNSNKMQLILIFSSPNLLMVLTTLWKCYLLGTMHQHQFFNFYNRTRAIKEDAREVDNILIHPGWDRWALLTEQSSKKKKVLAGVG